MKEIKNMNVEELKICVGMLNIFWESNNWDNSLTAMTTEVMERAAELNLNLDDLK